VDKFSQRDKTGKFRISFVDGSKQTKENGVEIYYFKRLARRGWFLFKI